MFLYASTYPTYSEVLGKFKKEINKMPGNKYYCCYLYYMDKYLLHMAAKMLYVKCWYAKRYGKFC